MGKRTNALSIPGLRAPVCAVTVVTEKQRNMIMVLRRIQGLEHNFNKGEKSSSVILSAKICTGFESDLISSWVQFAGIGYLF